MNTNTILDKYPGKRIEIPNFHRYNLPKLFVDLGYKVGAEIGIAKGTYTEKFLQAGLKMYAVDAFIDIFHHRSQAKIKANTEKLLSKYPNCTFIYKTSMEAVNDFKDESLDFVYIDADHRFRYIAEDLVEWSKKVRSGGVVSGHDYTHRKVGTTTAIEVDKVVDAYAKLWRIQNWWVFGRIPDTSDVNDYYLSWMWIKP